MKTGDGSTLTLVRVIGLTAIAAVAIAGPVRGQEVSTEAVMERVGAYATAFQRQFSNVVTEERYVQDIRRINLPPNRFPAVSHRELRSDLLLVQPSGTNGYVEFRDVFEVDGTPVRDRQDRLTKLFLDPAASPVAEIQSITRESARYNIGNIDRTINTPTLALLFLLPQNQPRFRFGRSNKPTPTMTHSTETLRGNAPQNFMAPTGAWVLEYEEVQRPTLIRTTQGLNLPARGRIWADPGSGRVLMSELIAEDSNVRATIDVSYQQDSRLGVMVPAEMRERYEGRRDGAVIEGTAVYGAIRQFQVQTNERVASAPPSRVEPAATAPSGTVISAPANDPLASASVSAPDSKTQVLEPAVLPAVPSTAPQTANPPMFRAGTELVLVDFVVTDKADRPVRGLSVKDVIVKEDGKERPIVSFDAFAGNDDSAAADVGSGSSARPAPLAGNAATVLLVDDGQLSLEQAARLRPSLNVLLTSLSGRSASFMLVAPWSKVSVAARLPTGAADLAAAVDRIVGQRIDDHSNFPVDDAEALAIFRGDLGALARVAGRFKFLNPELTAAQANDLARERANLLAHDARTRRDDMYDVALQCLDWLKSQPGRHSLIVVSAGVAQDPDDARYAEVVTRSLRANAPIHFLDARGLPGVGRYQSVENGAALSRDQDEGPFARWEAAGGSMTLADDTGGIAITNSNDMARGLGRLLDTMTTYYVLAYQPVAHGKPGFRRIKVEVRTKGLHVRARTGYFSSAVVSR